MNLADLDNYGLIAVIPVLTGVIVFLYNRIGAKDKRIDELQEKRLADAKEYNQQQNSAVSQMSNVIEKIYDAVTRNPRSS